MRLLVTRSEQQGRATAKRLSGLGHEGLVTPVLTIEPTDEPMPTGSFAGLILTSANALPGARAAAARMPNAVIAAVGQRCAEALMPVTSRPILVAEDAASLARLVIDRVPPCPLLLIAGRDRKREPAVSLSAAGFSVTIWETYRARIVERIPDAMAAALREGRLDAVLNYSRRSAGAALALVQQAGLGAEFLALRQLCLSRDVAEALTPAGGSVEIARSPDEAALFALIGEPRRARALHNPDAKVGTK
jgi:uroporphyrinogen-III synthase